MAFWCVLIFRLFQLQIIEYDKYQNKVINNIQRYTTLKAERGEIYDTNMTKLASNHTVYRVFISPRDIEKSGKAGIDERDYYCKGAENYLHIIPPFWKESPRLLRRHPL